MKGNKMPMENRKGQRLWYGVMSVFPSDKEYGTATGRTGRLKDERTYEVKKDRGGTVWITEDRITWL